MGPRRLLFLAAFLAATLCAASANSVVSVVTVPTVVLGTDYFQTQPGTFFNFGPGIGNVYFKGLPIGPFSTDTIIQRQANATINGGAIPIQMTALSLQSSQPVIFNGQAYEVFVTLDPAHLAQDTGTLTVLGTLAGGTFNSTLNVYFLATFVPVGGGQNIVIPNHGTLSQTGGTWSPTPPPHAVIVRGPVGNQAANLHQGLGPLEVDFFASGTEFHFGESGEHKVRPAVTPEPSALLLTGPALAALFLRWRLRHS